MVLLINLIHPHHRCQHLLPLCRAEVNTLLVSLLELLALDQPSNLDVVPYDQTSVLPITSVNPLHDHHTFIPSQLLPTLRPVIIECLLAIEIAVLYGEVSNQFFAA